MSVYWTTFRIEHNSGYEHRYTDLTETIRGLSIRWWIESTSFYLFESEHSIDQVATAIKGALDPDSDIALIGMPDYKSARFVGVSVDDDLFELMPFTKYA